MHIQTPLARAKGLGSAKTGLHHWWVQRLTAIALIPLVVWFVVMVLQAAQAEQGMLEILASPVQTGALLLFIVIGLYHGCLGMQVVIEDYVHCGCAKLTLLIITYFISVISGLAAALAVLYVHFGGV